MVEKKINFEYYQLTQSVDQGREALFDLEKWIDEIKDMNLSDRTFAYKDDKARVEEMYFNPTYNCWFLRFVRQRFYDVPSFSGLNTPSEFMKIGEDEFVTEDITCLYDTENNVLMIQKNLHSISPIGLEGYFNQTTPQDVIVNLRKIVSKDSFKKVMRSSNRRMIQIRLADLNLAENRGLLNNLKSSIGKMVKSLQQMPSPYMEVTFSVGRQRDVEVDEREFDLILKDVEKNPLLFDKASARVTQENEAKTELINLFLDSPKDTIHLQVKDRTDPIRFDVLMDEMGTIYFPGENRKNRKQDIDSYLIS